MNIGQDTAERRGNFAVTQGMAAENSPIGHDHDTGGDQATTVQTGAKRMSFLADATFFHVCMSLITVGLVERAMYLLPESCVGPDGWLLDTGSAE
jgi:hypothetical protein